MRKIAISAGIVIVLTAVLGLAGPASADGQGSCSFASGGLVKMNVKEVPNEGSVKYVSIASTVQLRAGADGSQVHTYYETDGVRAQGKWIYSSPVDGDGYWNYRADFNWDSSNVAVLRISLVWFIMGKYGSSDDCLETVNI